MKEAATKAASLLKELVNATMPNAMTQAAAREQSVMAISLGINH